jgi:chemotaxis protein MotA
MSSPTLRIVIDPVVAPQVQRRLVLPKGAAAGALLSVLCIAAGFTLEGGRLLQLLQSTALLVVCGGTLGAVLLQYPVSTITSAFRAAFAALCHVSPPAGEDLRQLRSIATRARRESTFSLERAADSCHDSFLAPALRLLAENSTAKDLRAVLEQTADSMLEQAEEAAILFDAAGGFSPTMGLLGAILGLIQVMDHLGRMDEVGRGIAIAFTATIYGVAAANLVLLPLAGRIRIHGQHLRQRRQLLIEGLLAIADGLSPAEMEARLRILGRARSATDGSSL